MNHIAPCGHPGIPVTPNFVTCPTCDRVSAPAPPIQATVLSNPYRSPGLTVLPPGKYRVNVKLSIGHTSFPVPFRELVKLHLTVLNDPNLNGQTFIIVNDFNRPGLGGEYVAARVKAYCVAAIAGDLNGVYESRTSPTVKDIENLDLSKMHIVDVTVTERANKKGALMNVYAWETVAHRS